MKITSLRAGFALALICVCLGGCAQTNGMKSNAAGAFDWSGPSKKILLVQPDIVLSELTAGGIQEPRADWTDTARGLVTNDIAGALGGKGIAVQQLGTLTNPHDIQLVKLHDAVGGAILIHGFGQAKLPTKGSALDWTLGPGTQDMRSRYGADYAMFVFVRDSYSTAGRRAVQFLGALVGVGIQGGTQVAFVSVVDLRTGNVVWFNTLISTTGDLRDEKGADSFVASLMKDNPL